MSDVRPLHLRGLGLDFTDETGGYLLTLWGNMEAILNAKAAGLGWGGEEVWRGRCRPGAKSPTG